MDQYSTISSRTYGLVLTTSDSLFEVDALLREVLFLAGRNEQVSPRIDIQGVNMLIPKFCAQRFRILLSDLDYRFGF